MGFAIAGCRQIPGSVRGQLDNARLSIPRAPPISLVAADTLQIPRFPLERKKETNQLAPGALGRRAVLPMPLPKFERFVVGAAVEKIRGPKVGPGADPGGIVALAPLH